MIANKIIPKLSKAIEKYGVNMEVYRSSLNDFGEKIGNNTLVSKFKGLYSESNHSIDKNKNSINDTAYECLLLKAEDDSIALPGGLTLANNSEYWLRLAKKYKPNGSRIL